PKTVVRQPDLVILGDVLEHMTRLEARGVLARMRDWARHVLGSMPLAHHDQDAVAGNWYEIHRGHWTAEQMRRELGPGLEDCWQEHVLGYCLWSADRVVGGTRWSGQWRWQSGPPRWTGRC